MNKIDKIDKINKIDEKFETNVWKFSTESQCDFILIF